MVNVNNTVAYIAFPYTLNKMRDFADKHNIRVGRFHFKAGKEHIVIYDDNETRNYLNKSAYDFRIVNGEIRLYFLKAEAAKLTGDNITFELRSWDVIGVGGQAWSGNVTLEDSVERGNHTVTLDSAVQGYVSWWDFWTDNTSSTTLWDVNRTSANDGIINGAVWNTTLGWT
jgi:hypothetical protein